MPAFSFAHRLGQLLLSVAATGWLLVSAPAKAADWSLAFPTEAVGSWAIGSDLRCVVVTAGAATPELQAAGSALQTALRADVDVKIVMGGESIADAATLPDRALLAQAQTLPIDLVAILRLVEGASGPVAIVALFDAAGSSKGGFIADAASPAPKKTAPTPPSEPVSSPTVVRPDALAQYKERMVWMQGWQAVNQYGQVLSTWSVPMKGQYGEALSLPRFYDYLGKPELAKDVRKRRWIRFGQLMGGVVVTDAGLAWLVVGALGGRDCLEAADYEACEATANRRMLPHVIAGSTVAAIGLGMTFVGIYFRTDKTRPHQRLRMIDEFNSALRADLGLPENLGD